MDATTTAFANAQAGFLTRFGSVLPVSPRSQSEGDSEMRRSSDVSVIEMPRPFAPDMPEAPSTVRAAIRALFARLGAAAPAIGEARDGEADEGRAAPAVATSFENKVRLMRANAHAAYRSVEGAEAAAIDAALAVVESEWHAARAQRDSFAEALKSIQLYAEDAKARAMAAQALASRVEAAMPCSSGARLSGRSRFPFMDEIDG